MTMQHKRGSFDGVDLGGFVSLPRIGGGEVQIRKSAISKLGNASDDLHIRIDHLSMASRTAVERIAADPDAPKAGWYCLRVQTNREMAVEKELTKADVECLVVMSNPYKTVRRARVFTVPSRPVIAGYVLVRCLPIPAAMMGLMRVGRKGDVIEVVGGAVSPYRAKDEDISLFKDLAEAGKYDHKVKPKHEFMLGEEVRVSDGPFASFHALVITIDDEHYRIKVEVNIFGRSTPVELDIDQIEKV